MADLYCQQAYSPKQLAASAVDFRPLIKEDMARDLRDAIPVGFVAKSNISYSEERWQWDKENPASVVVIITAVMTVDRP
jgi:hypothetical protein